MLHPVYGLRSQGYRSEYNAGHARTALDNFLSHFPEKESAYFEALRRAFRPMYEQLATQTEADFFLDKTPRYYLILSELARIFPDAHFILLRRNPLAVLASMITAADHRDLLHDLRGSAIDLFRAPSLLLQAEEELDPRRVSSIHYETLVENPDSALKRLTDDIGMTFEPSMLQYGESDQPNWNFGDQKVYERNEPDTSSLQKWKRLARDPQYWRLFDDYLNRLGDETVSQLGYDPDSLREDLEAHRPFGNARGRTLSLDWFLAEHRSTKPWEHAISAAMISVRRYGIAKTLLDSVKRMGTALSR